MTWRELKEFVNTLPENELEKAVIVWREDEVTSPIKAMKLEEDHYVGDFSSNICFPLSEAKEIVSDEDEFPNGIADLEKVYDKGHPILWEDF